MAKLFLYDFECSECGEVFEDMQDPSDNVPIECQKCHKIAASRTISPVRLDWQMGIDGGFPTAVDKWAKIQKDRARRDNMSGPNLWMH